MRKHGYNNLMFYTSASWLDENNLGYRGPVSTSQFGIENFWVAQYPSSSLTATSAKNMRYNAKTGAWQFSATANLLPGKHVFDQSVDYTGRFTANASVEADPTQGDLSGTISIVNNNPTLVALMLSSLMSKHQMVFKQSLFQFGQKLMAKMTLSGIRLTVKIMELTQ